MSKIGIGYGRSKSAEPSAIVRTMPSNIINFDTVRNLGLTFPGVEESTAYGSPVLKVHGKILAGIAVNRSAEPGSLMPCVDFGDRAELLVADPEVYY